MQPLSVEEVTDAVLSASRALVAVAARSLAAAAADVTLPQYRALVLLCSRGEIGMTDLAVELKCSPSTATRLCDRLVRKALITRGHPEQNRREVEITATAEGRRLVDRVTEQRRSELSMILSEVPDEARAAMVDALRAFATAAGEVPDQAWASGWDL